MRPFLLNLLLPILLLALIFFIYLHSNDCDGPWKKPFMPSDLLPLLPYSASWPLLRSLHSAVDLLPAFVGVVSSTETKLQWKGACFYKNVAWMEFHNKSKSPFGGGTLHIKGNTDESNQPQQNIVDPFQLPVISRPLQTNQMISTTSPLLTNVPTPQFPYHFTPHQLPHQHAQHSPSVRPDQQLQIFWANQLQEIRSTIDFKNHNLPLARIKKIMKADEDVKMIAAETPVLFSRACEMFILELTYRSWSQTEHSKRRTLQRSDISAAIARSQVFDFLVDIVPVEEIKEAGVSPIPGVEELNESISYFYDPSKFGSLMMDMRHPELDSQSLSYIQQQQDCMPQQMEQQQNFSDKDIDWC